jgi:hypothetical protein
MQLQFKYEIILIKDIAVIFNYKKYIFFLKWQPSWIESNAVGYDYETINCHATAVDCVIHSIFQPLLI